MKVDLLDAEAATYDGSDDRYRRDQRDAGEAFAAEAVVMITALMMAVDGHCTARGHHVCSSRECHRGCRAMRSDLARSMAHVSTRHIVHVADEKACGMTESTVGTCGPCRGEDRCTHPFSAKLFAEPPHPDSSHQRCSTCFLCLHAASHHLAAADNRVQGTQEFRSQLSSLSLLGTLHHRHPPCCSTTSICQQKSRYIAIAKPKSLDHLRTQHGALRWQYVERPAGQWL